MRPMMIATLLAVTSLTTPTPAEACGGYGDFGPSRPTVFAVETHHVPVEAGAARTRRFAVIAPAEEGEPTAWRPLAPMSFDATRTAFAPDLSSEITLTLVGPSSSRVVSAKHQALLANTFRHRGAVRAVELDAPADGRWTVAIMGTQPTATWVALASAKVTRTARKLGRAHGLELEALEASTVGGRPVVTGFVKDAPVTLVATGARPARSFAGRPIGGLDVDGVSYLLLEQGGLVTTISL